MNFFLPYVGYKCCSGDNYPGFIATVQYYSNLDFLTIHDGDISEIVGMLTGQINDTQISIPGNQMLVVFHTNEEIVKKGFYALIMESKYLFKINT